MIGLLLLVFVVFLVIGCVSLANDNMSAMVICMILAAISLILLWPAVNAFVAKKNAQVKRYVQEIIDTYRKKCNGKGYSIPELDLSVASQSSQNQWLCKILSISKKRWLQAQADFAENNGLLSEIMDSRSPQLGCCAVSSNAFYYGIDPKHNAISFEHFTQANAKPEMVTTYVATAEGKNSERISGFYINIFLGAGYATAKNYTIDQFFEEFLSVMDLLKNVSAQKILLDDIIHFKIEGDVHYVSHVTGTGGGVNVQGAVKGALEFGVVGAVVGSKIGTEQKISTTTQKKDNRTILLTYRQNGKITSHSFSSTQIDTTIDVLRKLIPDKEMGVISEGKQQLAARADSVASTGSNLAQIKELKELFDMGAITQDEFDTKKRQLLGL